VDKYRQIGPNVMYGIQSIMIDDLFQDDLNPCRNSHDNSNIPVFRLFNNLIELGRPVAFARNPLSRLVEMLEPKGQITGLYS